MAIDIWKIKNSKYVIQDRWLTVRADTCETSKGLVVDPYYVLECKEWVHIVALEPAGRILVTKQYRHGSQTICVEIPCGEVEQSDASTVVAAKRELLEETGYCAGEFIEAGKVFANPARQNNRVHCFLALDAYKTQESNQDESEAIEYEFIELAKLFELIDNGQFSQALHISSIFLALRKHGLLSMV